MQIRLIFNIVLSLWVVSAIYSCIFGYKRRKSLPLWVILAFVLVVYWLFMALVSLYWVRKTFKKYQNMPRLDLPEKFRHIIRRDFGKWDQNKIMQGCFINFPLTITIYASYVLIFGALVTIKNKIGFPDLLINFHRHIGGRLATQFDFYKETETVFMISNHISQNDIIYMMTFKTKFSFVSKWQIGQLYVIGTISKYIKSLFVDRASRQNRHYIKQSMIDRAQSFKKDPKNTQPIAIYPQGTTSNGIGLLQFNNGAFEPLLPVTVLSLNYQSKGFNQAHDEVNMWEHFLFTCCLRPTLKVKKQVMTPLEGQKVQEFRERCRQKMAQMGNLQLSECNYKDVLSYWQKVQGMLREQLNAHSS